jgi:hypothetical protein
LRSLDGSHTLFQLGGYGRRPDLMVIAHRDYPVSHAASWVSEGDCRERPFRFLVFKGMEPGYRPVELFVGGLAAGNRKIDASDLLCCVLLMIVLMSLLRPHRRETEHSKESNVNKCFISGLPRLISLYLNGLLYKICASACNLETLLCKLSVGLTILSLPTKLSQNIPFRNLIS